MITHGPAFWAGDKACKTLEEAQTQEIENLANDNSLSSASKSFAEFVMTHKARILDILTTTKRSKPRARAINGGTRKRKPKVEFSGQGGGVQAVNFDHPEEKL